MRLTEPSTQSEAAAAIALCRAGAIEDGIALYRKILKQTDTLPVGLHLRFLQSSGLHDIAHIIRKEALAAGADLCVNEAMEMAPLAIANEYSDLFSQGLINARMISNYLVALCKLGARDELGAIIDPDKRLEITQLTFEESGTAHWKLLEQILLDAESNDTWEEATLSVRKMHKISHLDRRPGQLIQSTIAELDRQVARYVTNWRKSDHPISRWVPDRFRISTWAIISHGEGYNVPHTHKDGWVSGVLYVTGPACADDGLDAPGALRIGPPPGVEDISGWPNISIVPTPGTLVLMPSYYTHWTVPLGRPSLRIAIAFDAIELRNDQDINPPPKM